MSITIKIGDAAKESKVVLELDIRKSLAGDFMIFDHGDMDIVVSPKKNKIILFPKDTMTDLVYGAQNRLFAHLHKKGIIILESVQAGAFYGSLEGSLEVSEEDTSLAPKLALINISSFIEEERPYFESVEAIISMDDDQKIEPEKADSTELGEVPHSTEKGSMKKGFIRNPYSLNYLYTL